MKIGILTIATGKYSMYLEGLVNSSRKNFLPGSDIKFFIFTEDTSVQGHDIIRLHQEKLGWPFDSMLRFHMFCQIESLLQEMDYLFFMNANCEVASEIGKEILPDNNCGITVALHPGFFNKSHQQLPYEFREESEFYVEKNEASKYFQGCFNGGKRSDFLKMSRILKDKMDIDLSKKIIPIWHDESALNWYTSNKDPLILPPTYAYPEFDRKVDIEKILKEKNEESDWKGLHADISLAKINEDPHKEIIEEFGSPKIVMRDKNKDGGKIYLRK